MNLHNRQFSGSIAFESCKFDQPVRLEKTILKNGLAFKDCTFGTAESDLGRSAIVLDDARIRGDLVFDQVETFGYISARRLRLVGDMQFAACTITADASEDNAALAASDSEIHGSVFLRPANQRWALQIPPHRAVGCRPRNDQSFAIGVGAAPSVCFCAARQ